MITARCNEDPEAVEAATKAAQSSRTETTNGAAASPARRCHCRRYCALLLTAGRQFSWSPSTTPTSGRNAVSGISFHGITIVDLRLSWCQWS
mmetsp:Transcript_4457/g.9240  ORF Transcript_4457/g.9240 Transcript_4457/m.9240 type:complete len:92 (+) Transcript_4457:202-477(+)